MKITATTTSTPLNTLLTEEQKIQISWIDSSSTDFVYAMKIVWAWTLYIENNWTATTTDSTPRTSDDWVMVLSAKWFSKAQVRSWSSTIDVRILPMI
jgi:hypothetical protein